MPKLCKICQHPVAPQHTINDITYYLCPNCNLLQNYYWEEHPNSAPQQTTANDIARADRWPAGNPDDMYAAAWRMVEYMASPVAWFSRQLQAALKHIPSYAAFTRAQAKRRMHRILDFGCGHGVGVLELRARDGFNALGLDPFSPTDSPYIIRQSIHEVNFEPNSFDGIFAIETMEHIGDILPTFAALHRLLRPGGVLLVQTRRLEDPDYQRDQDQWFYLKDPTTHVTIYSEHAMTEIAKRTGFEPPQFRNVRLARFTKPI